MADLSVREQEALTAHTVSFKQDNELARIEREVFEAAWHAARDFYAPYADEANAQRRQLGLMDGETKPRVGA
jgi:hypothetical protein